MTDHNTQPSKKFLASLAGIPQDVPPIWLMRQAGRYLPEYMAIRNALGGFLDLCHSPKDACEVTLQPIRRYDLDAAILFSDILIVPQGLGQNLWFETGEGPKLSPLESDADIDKLDPNGFHERIDTVYEAVDRIKTALPQSCAFIGFAGAPWTVATYMIEGGSSRDFANTKAWAFQHPKRFQRLMNLLSDITADYLIAQVKAGVEVVQLFDSWAGVLPDRHFDQWIIEPTKRLVERFRASCPDTPFIGFPRGASFKYPDYIEKTGVTAVGLDTTIPMAYAKSDLQTRVPVQGNLDPMLLLAGGDAMREQTGHILDHLKDGPFIFNLGHGIIKETPPEYVSDLIRFIREDYGNV